MKYIFVFVLGCLACYYFPTEVEQVVQQSKEIVHETAVKTAEATKDPTIIDKFLGK